MTDLVRLLLVKTFEAITGYPVDNTDCPRCGYLHLTPEQKELYRKTPILDMSVYGIYETRLGEPPMLETVKQATKLSPVNEVLRDVEQSLSMANQMLIDLEIQLQPVLSPARQECPDKLAGGVPSSCELHASLLLVHENIKSLVYRVEELRTRICV